jgi:hypothetical protein
MVQEDITVAPTATSESSVIDENNVQPITIIQSKPIENIITDQTNIINLENTNNTLEVPAQSVHARWSSRDRDLSPALQVQQKALSPEGADRDDLDVISVYGKDNIWGLSKSNELYHLVKTPNGLEWQYFPTEGMKFKDISCTKRNILFAIGADDGLLYRLAKSKMELVVPSDTTKFVSVSAMSKRRIYAVAENGTVMSLKIRRVGKGPNRWDLIGGRMKKVASGSRHRIRRSELWGIGPDDRAYRFDGSVWCPFNIELKDISVAKDNSVYGVRKEDGRLVKWDRGEQFLLQEKPATNNDQQFAKLTRVSAYREGKHVYAIEEDTSNILRMVF